MKNYFEILFILVLFDSCGSMGTKKKVVHNTGEKYITVVDYLDGYSTAYTDDGNTIIYKNDSVGDYIVYSLMSLKYR